MSIANPLAFLVLRTYQMLSGLAATGLLRLRIERIRRRVAKDPGASTYMDAALSPAHSDGGDTLEMYDSTESARQNVARVRKHAAALTASSV